MKLQPSPEQCGLVLPSAQSATVIKGFMVPTLGWQVRKFRNFSFADCKRGIHCRGWIHNAREATV